MSPPTLRWTNPLDWRPIDRHLLLGAMLMLVPLVLGGWLAATLWLAPEYLNHGIATALLALYLVQALLLGTLLLVALRLRRTCLEWPLLENFVIVSLVVSVVAGSYASGTLFTQGMLILLLGVNIALGLANTRKIYLAFMITCAIMALLAIVELTRVLPHAVLFARPPVREDGSITTGWLAFQVLVAFLLLPIIRITIAVVGRWVERENIYREMSSIDGLTRLSNRRTFIERGQSEIKLAQRTDLGSVACVLLDLDHFKLINDTWGHHAGDQVLVAASNILMHHTREYDEVGRYGGEEFAILMPGLSLLEAAAAAERICTLIAAKPVIVDGNAITVTASMGVACFPAANIVNLNELLKAADQALYQAKKRGRNQVVTTVDLNTGDV